MLLLLCWSRRHFLVLDWDTIKGQRAWEQAGLCISQIRTEGVDVVGRENKIRRGRSKAPLPYSYGPVSIKLGIERVKRTICLSFGLAIFTSNAISFDLTIKE